jgi:K+-sensing histidine kinase KdpD
MTIGGSTQRKRGEQAMADTIEMMQGRDRGASEATDPPAEDGGLISRVSAAGYQIAQAGDGLQQAAGLLRAAEELARDADVRRRAAQQRLASAQTEVAELTDMLSIARAAQGDADGRARAAEQRLEEVQTEVEELTDMVRVARGAQADADERARAADQRFAGVRGEIEELTEMVALARAAQAESDERARLADERARLADEQTRLSDERARLAEERVDRVADRTTAMELALGDLEDRWRSAEATPKVTVVEERDELQEAVAAEIRRPLTSILGLTLALKQADVKAGDGKLMVRQLGTNAKRLERLVEQMLDLDKIASGSYAPKRRRTDLGALVGRVAEETPDVANRDLKIVAEHVAIEVDPGLTEQMVETLLTNAGRRTAPGGKIWVTVVPDEDGAVIAVEDASPDAPPPMPSDRESAGMRSQKHRASGLPLLSRLAELHGGRAWVEERAGGGASFRVSLPSASAVEPDGSVTPLDLIEDVEELPFDADRVETQLRELSSFDDLSDGIAV